jgi:hypothetical protein
MRRIVGSLECRKARRVVLLRRVMFSSVKSAEDVVESIARSAAIELSKSMEREPNYTPQSQHLKVTCERSAGSSSLCAYGRYKISRIFVASSLFPVSFRCRVSLATRRRREAVAAPVS